MAWLSNNNRAHSHKLKFLLSNSPSKLLSGKCKNLWRSLVKNIIHKRILPMVFLFAFFTICALSVSTLKENSLLPAAHAASSYTIKNSVQNQPPPGCSELIQNGGFETLGPEWELNRSARPPMHVSDITHDNSGKSIQLGIVNLANVESSSFVKQTVSLPTGVTSIFLTFYYYTRGNPSPDADVQFVEIFNNLTGTFLTRVLTEQSNTGDWVAKQYNLTAYAGQQINLYFAVENDGGNGSLAMNVDNVSILACNPLSTATSTPTTTPLPTLTPTIDTSMATAIPPFATSTAIVTRPPVVNPSNCRNYLIDGNFEAGNAYFDNDLQWHRGRDPVQAQLTNAESNSGNYSVVLGNPPNNGESNQLTYSSIRQLVSIPLSVAQLDLRWRHLTKSEEAADSNPDRTSDRADVIFLEPDLIPIEVIHRHRNKPADWKIESESINTAKYSGRNFYVYFNVYNDGNGRRTWSFVDDIELIGCQVSAVLPTPIAAVAPATMAPTTTPVPTRANPTATNRSATSIPTRTFSGPPTSQSVPQLMSTETGDPLIMSGEDEQIPGYSVTRIQPAVGLQVPTTLPTYAPERNNSSWIRGLLSSSDPDPQPTNTFRGLQMMISCLMGVAVLGFLLFIVQALIGRNRIPFIRRLFRRR